MAAIVMLAANDGINRETGYGQEHEKKDSSERHYAPLPPAYENRATSRGFAPLTKRRSPKSLRRMSFSASIGHFANMSAVPPLTGRRENSVVRFVWLGRQDSNSEPSG